MSIINRQILDHLPHPDDEAVTLDSMNRALDAYCDECDICTDCIFHIWDREYGQRCRITTDNVARDDEESLKELYIKLYQLQEYEKGLEAPFIEAEPQEEQPTEDLVNHPSHYTHGGMECIDEMLMIFGKEAVMHFCVLNAWKYRKRALYKNGEQDQSKSDWYLQKYKELKLYGTEQPEQPTEPTTETNL